MLVLNSCLAEYKAEIYLNTGALIVDNKIDVVNDKLVLGSKMSVLDIKLINNINFIFDDFNNDVCSSLFRSKKFTSLEGLLEEIIPLKKFSNLQSNLFDYYVWLLKSNKFGMEILMMQIQVLNFYHLRKILDQKICLIYIMFIFYLRKKIILMQKNIIR